MGGVVEVNTLKSQIPDFTDNLLFSAAPMTQAAARYSGSIYVGEGNTFGVSASGNMTNHYLNPVVPENYTNNGTTASFSGKL
jgi:hypothetical protein